MPDRPTIPAITVLLLLAMSNSAFALGFERGESKEELKLDYEIEITDHGTGRVTVNFVLEDAGRLGPLDAVKLVVPGSDGTGRPDLTVDLKPREHGDRQHFRVHLLRETAARAELHLTTWHFDGEMTPLTWWYHVVELDESLPPSKASLE